VTVCLNCSMLAWQYYSGRIHLDQHRWSLDAVAGCKLSALINRSRYSAIVSESDRTGFQNSLRRWVRATCSNFFGSTSFERTSNSNTYCDDFNRLVRRRVTVKFAMCIMEALRDQA